MIKRRSMTHTRAIALTLLFAGWTLGPDQAAAQTPPPPPAPLPLPTQLPPPYGAPITLDTAKQVMAAAESEADKNKWPVVIVIVDSGGNIVMLHQRDDTQLSAIATAEGKARTALYFKRSTKSLDDVISAGGSGLRYLALKDFVPLEGGIPIMLDGKIVGAIGVSGVLSAQDTQVARAGVDAIAK